ncbi:FAD-binding protein [Corynebacterium deserti]|uniref:FAD-binding protein n=1 Tax=Corynebacterium deserti TaxID=1408191 RepID=UPI0006AD350F
MTIEVFNDNACRSEDPKLGRGESESNRYGGDPRVAAHLSLAPIEKGSFYAVNVVPGSFGTFAGIKADGKSRVFRADNTVIDGLGTAGKELSQA